MPLPLLLSHLPKNGAGARVFQSRWVEKGLPVPTGTGAKGCYWEVKKVDLSFREGDGKPHAVVWGVGYWKGKRITPADKQMERIKGALKYAWKSEVMPVLPGQSSTSKA